MKKLALAPLMIMAALLAGCGGAATTSGSASPSVTAGSATSAAASPSEAAPSSSASSSAAESASASPSSSASGGTDAVDVCARLSVAEVNRLAGTSYTAQAKQTNRCTYGSKTGTPSGRDVGLLTGLKESTASLATLVASEKKSLGASSSKSVTIDGADEAAVVLSSDQGKHVVSVLAKRRNVLYIVITEGENSSATYTTAATKVMAALIAG